MSPTRGGGREPAPSKPTHIHELDLIEVAKLIRCGEISAVEVTEAMLSRIAELDPGLRSYARVLPELAMVQAQAADEARARGMPLGPLHGVPIGIKDLFWVAGHVTAFGTTVHDTFISSEDATVVRRLREAGAVILGKLQMTEGAFALHHSTVQVPVNPWGADHWSGASSSGSGVATAACLCFAALGTDTGGSIRFPCAANGITGIRPTWGLVSRHGAFEFAGSLDHVGPMARCAADAALILGVIAGHDPLDPTSLAQPAPTLPLAVEDLGGLRLGVDPQWNASGTDAEVAAAMDVALETLRGLGAELREVRFPDARAVIDEWECNAGVEAAVAHAEVYPRLSEQYGAALSRLLDLGRNTTATEFQRVLNHRAAFRGRLTELMTKLDLLALPVQPYAAPTYERLGGLAGDPEANSRLIQYTAPINSSGHPSITLPCGFTAQGLPVAFQLVARHGGEALLCRAGIAFQAATDWHLRRPPL